MTARRRGLLHDLVVLRRTWGIVEVLRRLLWQCARRAHVGLDLCRCPSPNTSASSPGVDHTIEPAVVGRARLDAGRAPCSRSRLSSILTQRGECIESFRAQGSEHATFACGNSFACPLFSVAWTVSFLCYDPAVHRTEIRGSFGCSYLNTPTNCSCFSPRRACVSRRGPRPARVGSRRGRRDEAEDLGRHLPCAGVLCREAS